jgi:sortase (surface protein transpeptidase)
LSAKPLTDLAGIGLRAGPVDMPLELRIPSLQLNAPVLAVGITAKNAMDAPGGLADDAVWQKAFWYRGSGIPGDSGTATIAGHVVDMLGRPAVFARLEDLRPGNLIIIHDTRSGLDVRFRVVETESYSVEQAADLAVLAQIYGSGPVSGKGPQPASDGLAHLTLITCSGDFINGSYDHRWVVYAERVQAMPRGRATEGSYGALE